MHYYPFMTKIPWKELRISGKSHLYRPLRTSFNTNINTNLMLLRDNLIKEEEKLIKELNEIELELSKYQAVREFEQIVQAFIEVNKEIEKVSDDILRIENFSWCVSLFGTLFALRVNCVTLCDLLNNAFIFLSFHFFLLHFSYILIFLKIKFKHLKDGQSGQR